MIGLFWILAAVFAVLSLAALYRACRHQVKEVHAQHDLMRERRRDGQ
ncbi:hypothetical protein ABAC460_10220 [Asticcacaulis sp. AC460]|nr:hypothetical protein [Asticcacaulis sp. AC460]ESQ90123.1 hypothetical protein ABAC460_10220 [Asticcacaulis sp. AC460]